MRGCCDVAAADIPWTLPPAPDVPHDPEDLLVEALVEAQSYRTVAQQAIHALHDLTQQHDRLRTSHHRLIDKHRRLRESILRAELAS